MSAEPEFPDELLLHDPGHGARLVGEFYEQYHETVDYRAICNQQEEEKTRFCRERLKALGHDERSLGLEVGCRGGVIIKLVGLIRWLGVDIDEKALEVARASGIACTTMDFTFGIGCRDASFDAVMMTEVLEHLPFPSITVREVHRILKPRPQSLFFGSVPLDYHLHRRWKVMRGKRLSGDQTHVHHFSFRELDQLLRFYFETVDYLPLTGTATRYPRLPLSYNLFVRDMAWVASAPRSNVGRWGLGRM